MNIINNHPYCNRNVSFGTCACAYENSNKNSITGANIYTTTSLFRNDLEFDKLADYAVKNFADKDKVNIYCLAGSDGSEAYSLAIALMERIPKSQYKKFFPIISIDRDHNITKAAQSGRINLSELDLENLKKITNKEYFIDPQPAQRLKDNMLDENSYKSYKVVPELRDAVEFREGNLLTELSEIKDDGNSIVLCRNVFPYLFKSAVSHATYDASNNLKKGSLFAIGNFDNKNTDIGQYLLYSDFNEVLHNVYKHC